MKKTQLPPLKPTTFELRTDREQIAGISGGILPVNNEIRSTIAACSCAIGNYRMKIQPGLPRYDSLPGTNKEDTKNSLTTAYALKKLGAPNSDKIAEIEKKLGTKLL
jgi:hypothetical protein